MGELYAATITIPNIIFFGESNKMEIIAKSILVKIKIAVQDFVLVLFFWLLFIFDNSKNLQSIYSYIS